MCGDKCPRSPASRGGALGVHVAPSMAWNCNAACSALSLRLRKELEKEMLAIAKPRRIYVSGQSAAISHFCLPALHAFLLLSVQKLPREHRHHRCQHQRHPHQHHSYQCYPYQQHPH